MQLVRPILAALRAGARAPAGARAFSTGKAGSDSILVSDITPSGNRTSVVVGLMNHFQSGASKVGFFEPVAGKNGEILSRVFNLAGDNAGATAAEASKMLADGKKDDLMDQIYTKFQATKSGKDLTVVGGTGTELDATLAQALSTPVLLTLAADRSMSAEDIYTAALSKRQAFADKKVDVVGLMLTGVPKCKLDGLTGELKEKLAKSGLPLVGALPEEDLLSSLSLEEVRKAVIAQTKAAFDQHVDVNTVVAGLQKPKSTDYISPKAFQYGIFQSCLANPQHIVLPESSDKRILAAAAEITQRRLAKVTVLGNPETVAAEAKKLGLDLTGVNVVDPNSSARMDHYVSMLVEARKSKGMTPEEALKTLQGDINYFGTMMVAAGDADGMVSGAMHTTAATIRPALTMLRTPDKNLVSSIFFMCLEDRVLVYGDCAVVVNPNPEDLARVAATSADTAAAFGFDPRVAMLSYSTLGSGAGPEVQKVTDATAIVKSKRPDLKVEGPLQYDASVDMSIAKTKIKGGSAVAGKANVFVFPDLNTGNNCYKAVQQSTGAIAMGPVMQGLSKPVNDLSRGCTVPDIVNTVCVTSIQAMFHKKK
ncbi:hypothetical protein Agub_g11086 [Astrephomene gubernaculifera]|uniref:Phosphate acetyltransferase n=1 Tax=Astrephomene gubernaculifera TaxID=47775 RepID=A0AAD3DVW0_9CHLO|nr:hypothetical protein Agub_g11086 [Astrephomene gubernaculifera]